MSKPESAEFSRQLTELRQAAGLSTNKLAQLAGLDQSLLSKIERGIRRPTDQAIEKLAKALNADYAQLRRLADRDRLGEARLRAIKEAEELLGSEPWERLAHERGALVQEIEELEAGPQDEAAMVRRKEIEERLFVIAEEVGEFEGPAHLTMRQACDLARVPVLTPRERRQLTWLNQFSRTEIETLLCLTREQVRGLVLLLSKG